jgi:uncharacterized RDD family membrane protein YckC
VTSPDPDGPGAERDAVQPPAQGNDQPPPGVGHDQPPPGQGADQGYQPPPGQGADQGYQPPPGPGLPPAPPVPAGYGYGEYPATAVPQGMYFDQESGLALPDGTVLAPVGRRIGAWFLAIPLVIVTLGIGYIVWGLIVWGNGQTPALQVLGMRCWRPETNRVAGFWYMALREIVGRFVEGILGIFTEAASFIMMCTGRQRKAIHDWIAGTVVLRDPDKVLAR